MEILGRSLASLPPDISKALENLAEGIAQSTPFGLNQAIDSFSAENIGQMELPWDGPTMPVIGGQADFLSPTDFISQTKSMSESNPIFEEIQSQLRDSKFDQNAAFTSFANSLFGGNGIIDNLIGRDGVLAEALGGVAFPPAGTDPAQKQGVSIGGSERGIVISDGRIGDSTATTGAKPSDPIGDRGIILVGGKSFGDPVAAQQFATPGAKPSDPLGDRGVIVTGGKSLGDPAASQHLAAPGLLPTLDDSMTKLKNLDPYTSEGRQTLSVFQQQLGVLQGMEGTVKTQSALIQQMGTSLKGKILG